MPGRKRKHRKHSDDEPVVIDPPALQTIGSPSSTTEPSVVRFADEGQTDLGDWWVQILQGSESWDMLPVEQQGVLAQWWIDAEKADPEEFAAWLERNGVGSTTTHSVVATADLEMRARELTQAAEPPPGATGAAPAPVVWERDSRGELQPVARDTKNTGTAVAFAEPALVGGHKGALAMGIWVILVMLLLTGIGAGYAAQGNETRITAEGAAGTVAPPTSTARAIPVTDQPPSPSSATQETPVAPSSPPPSDVAAPPASPPSTTSPPPSPPPPSAQPTAAPPPPPSSEAAPSAPPATGPVVTKATKKAELRSISGPSCSEDAKRGIPTSGEFVFTISRDGDEWEMQTQSGAVGLATSPTATNVTFVFPLRFTEPAPGLTVGMQMSEVFTFTGTSLTGVNTTHYEFNGGLNGVDLSGQVCQATFDVSGTTDVALDFSTIAAAS